MKASGLKIGVTFFLRKGERSIWSNGADQNCVFLLELLKRCGGVERVFAINAGEDVDAAPAGMMLGPLRLEFVRPGDVANDLDIIIEAGAQLSADYIAGIRARGGRAVAYRFGNAYVIDAERVIHGKESGSIFNGACFDAVWTNAQHERTCAPYWETCYRAPVVILPHIWEPTFIDAAIRELPDGCTFGYRPGRRKKRVAVFEPNINIVKTCITPMLVCERAYRRRPDLLEHVYVTNADRLKGHVTFEHFALNLDIVRAGICSFESRFKTPWFLASEKVDVVLAHQWECGLNYAYYDALHGGYPLVHNSDLLPADVGYHYRDFDCRDGGQALIAALLTHDANEAAYRKTASDFLATVRATAPANIEAHERALAAL